MAISYIKCMHCAGASLTDGLFGSPTRWPHVVSRLTRHSRTRLCDIHGRFQPLSCTVSAGDRLALRRGEPSEPTAAAAAAVDDDAPTPVCAASCANAADAALN